MCGTNTVAMMPMMPMAKMSPKTSRERLMLERSGFGGVNPAPYWSITSSVSSQLER